MGSAIFWVVLLGGLAWWGIWARHRQVEQDRWARRFDARLRAADRAPSSTVRIVGPHRPPYNWDDDAPEVGPLAEYRQTG